MAEYAAKVICGAKVHERVSASMLWSVWTASKMGTKDLVCSHTDPDSTGCMRAHLLSASFAQGPLEAQGTPGNSLCNDPPGRTVRSCGEGGHTIGQKLAIGFLGFVWALEVSAVRIRYAAGSTA